MSVFNLKNILLILGFLAPFQMQSQGVQVSIKVLLEGPYSNGLLSDVLREKGLIPTTEPYSNFDEFVHVNGGGGEMINNSLLNLTGEDAIIDWVFVELRSATNPENILFTRSALLQRDGDIVDTDGVSPLNFSNAPNDNYYLGIAHRNHLTIISNTTINLSITPTPFDFTNSFNTAFGNNSLKNLNGKWGMYAADVNHSGSITLEDRDRTWEERLAKGYFDEDVDFNGIVDLMDRRLAWNNQGMTEQIPPTTGGGDADITITVTFNNSISTIPNIDFTKLRFNKDFAYSLTFDDGKVNDIDIAYPIMSGGMTPDGQTHQGHFYTDGCGNDQVFRAGISLPSQHIVEVNNGMNFMNWTQVNTLIQYDWDLFSHGFTHCAYTNCDYDYEVTESVNKILTYTGFKVSHFMVPSGDDEGYTIPAFDNGMLSVHDQQYLFPGNGGLEIPDQMNLFQFKLHRNTLELEDTPYGEDIDNVAAVAQSGNKYWFSEYLHKVGYPADSYVQVYADDFKAYMTHIENNYGRYGSDRVWFAPAQEVYEYHAVKNNIQLIDSQISGNQLIIELDTSNIPDNLRRNAISLLLDAQGVSNVEVSGAAHTFNQNGLINLDW